MFVRAGSCIQDIFHVIIEIHECDVDAFFICQLFQAVEVRHIMERSYQSASAAGRINCSVITDYGNVFNRIGVQRQNVRFVFQQHDSFSRNFQCGFCRFGVVEGNARI